MQINAIYDPSASNAPIGFTAAVQAAIDYFDNLITNNITISINFGWGEVNAQALDPQALGENIANGSFYNYSQVSGALRASAVTADDRASVATLPALDPTPGGQFFVTTPQAMALGLRNVSFGTSGYIGLNSSFQYTFDPANRAVAHKYDAIAIVEHEISEVLGRAGSLGTANGSNVYTPLDLFRYSSAGVRSLTPGPGFFSVDGQTMLLAYNDPTNGGDAADWASSVVADAFGSGFAGKMGVISQTDLREMDLLGYTLRGASLPPPQLVATTPAANSANVALGSPIVLSFNEAVNLGSGRIQIHSAATGGVLATISITDTSQVSVSGAAVTVRPTNGLPAGAAVYVTADSGAITDVNGTPYGGVTSPTTLAFADMSAAQAVSDWVGNALRASSTVGTYASLGSQLTSGLSAGTITFPQAISSVSQAANSTTSVATLAYEFFTGATPTAAGLDYLVSPTGPNPNNLNSPYYQTFNEANRYINFSVNLGKAGAGANSFASHYASLSLADATSQEYSVIFGATPTAAKVDSLLNTQVTSGGLSMTRADYLALYGGDGLTGVGTKAAVAGWLLSEAEHAGVGIFATANASYISDLAQGQASFNIDLVGVYHGTPYLGG
jgi:hypothetical protein